jgi:O-antigen/teichoic acid export membrane protein
MTAAAKAMGKGVWVHGLKRRALSLGAVKAFDHALQFLLPVVLVRCLDAATFGEYRLLWLAVGTVMAFATLNMCGALYFFVPRSEPARKRLYVHQTLLYLAAAGIVCGVAVSAWNPWMPPAVEPLERYGALVPAFVALWVVAILLDYLPTVDERIGWQAWATLSVSGLRALMVGFGAWVSGEMRVILWLLVATVAVKLALLLVYVRRKHGLGRPWLERAAFSEQLRHAAPIGLSNAAYNLRAQADQWVAASLFALTSFAAFSIAALVAQVVHVFRHSVLEAILPSMSRLHAAGDERGMMEMNSRANVIVGTLLFPLLAFAFVFAGEIVSVVYTAAYVEAVPAMRVYVLGMLAMVVEIGSIVLLLRQGAFALKVSGVMLAFSVVVSLAAAQHFGLAGAAAGSVLAIYFDRILMLRRISRLTGLSLRRMQDWRSLAWALASAILAGALAWLLAEHALQASSAFVRAVFGGSVLLLVYALLNLKRK